MIRRFAVLAFAFLLTGCSTAQQFVYNCTTLRIRFPTGIELSANSYFAVRASNPPFTVNDLAQFPDETSQKPIRVSEERIRGSERGNTWSEATNVCAQFAGQVVIVDLK